jgi:hypothetical protein
MEKAESEEISVGDWVRVKMVKWDYDDSDTLDAKVLGIKGDEVALGYDDKGVLMYAFIEDCKKIEL